MRLRSVLGLISSMAAAPLLLDGPGSGRKNPGKAIPKFVGQKWVPGILITSLLFTGAWGYLVYTGDITTIWPLFGMSNQLLASTGLIIVTTIIIRLVSLSAIIMVLMVFVIIGAIRRCYDLYQVKETVIDRYGNPVLVRVEK